MNSTNPISVETRQDLGKTAMYYLRKKGMTPGMIYQKDNKNGISVSMPTKNLVSILSDYRILTKMIPISLNNKEIYVIIKEVQFDSISDSPIHIDFMEVKEGTEVTVNAPVKIINKQLSTGIKRGGNINLTHYNLPLKAKISKEPIEIILDAKDSVIGQKFYLSNAILPENAKIVSDRLVGKLVGKKVAATTGEKEGEKSEASKDDKKVDKTEK